MDLLRDKDIDPAALRGKRVAILGFGNQGRAQALNLKDSGVDVFIGLRDNSPSFAKANADGVAAASMAEATRSADIVMFLAPDEVLPELYARVEPELRAHAAIGFSHGLAIHFDLIEPRRDLDVFLLAPKGPGTALRSLYQQGEGMIALWAAAQDASGNCREIALAYGRAVGCARAGLIVSSFAEECEADLFNEQAVVWGAVPEILRAGFETLTEAGVSAEVAFLECVGELKLIAGLIEERGIAGMREAISNTAEFGALLGGKAVIDDSVRKRMRDILVEIRSGRFAEELMRERTSGYLRLKRERDAARDDEVEKAFRSLRRISGD